jgi:hypothetical protein
MTPSKTNLDFRTCSVSGNDKTPFRRAGSIDVGLFLQAELGVQQSCEEKASGIFTPCGMFS